MTPAESDEVASVTQGVGSPRTIDIRRSLVVTEQTILAGFSLERVMNQLVAESGVPNLTATALFNQWWDTQNPGPGLGLGPHCDDQVDPTLGTTINGYPYLCRPAPSEGTQAACDPFAVDSPCAYVPIGLFNRFDLTPEDGSNCGEHRIVFAKASGIASTSDRVTIIFEAVMPNPSPQLGLRGCQTIVETWAALSQPGNITARATRLESFYFNGHGNVPPVVKLAHYGDNVNDWGQIRTNQFSMTTTGWSLREFKLASQCSGSSCSSLKVVPVTNKTNAFGELFDPASTHPNAAAFAGFFPTQVEHLTAGSIAGVGMNVPDLYNTAQSQSSGSTADEMKYLDRFSSDPSPLRTSIQAELTSLGSALTPDDVVARAQTTSCAGCHRLSRNVGLGGGLAWPADLGFVHVSERVVEQVGGEDRFGLSNALLNFFLPHRKAVMEDFLNNKPRPPQSNPQTPIGGSTTHG